MTSQAVHVGQAEVDDDDVRLARADLDHAVGAGRRLEESIALALERRAEEAWRIWGSSSMTTTTGSGHRRGHGGGWLAGER